MVDREKIEKLLEIKKTDTPEVVFLKKKIKALQADHYMNIESGQFVKRKDLYDDDVFLVEEVYYNVFNEDTANLLDVDTLEFLEEVPLNVLVSVPAKSVLFKIGSGLEGYLRSIPTAKDFESFKILDAGNAEEILAEISTNALDKESKLIVIAILERIQKEEKEHDDTKIPN
jgi:hypothetical protein